jgi:hypothetical protein
MQSDVFSEFHVDFEGLARPRGSCDRAAEGGRALRVDRAGSAGRFLDGAAVVAVSPAETWGWLRAGSREVIVVPAIGRSDIPRSLAEDRLNFRRPTFIGRFSTSPRVASAAGRQKARRLYVCGLKNILLH